MSKKRKTFSLSEENHEFLTNHDNASALVDRLVTQFRTGGQDESVIKEYRMKQVAAEIEMAKKQLEMKKDELDALESEKQSAEKLKEVELSEARDALSETPKDPTNPGIQKWADDLDMTPQELINEL